MKFGIIASNQTNGMWGTSFVLVLAISGLVGCDYVGSQTITQGKTAQMPPLLSIDFHYELRKKEAFRFFPPPEYMPVYTISVHF